MTRFDDLVGLLIERRMTVAVAESLTGGMLAAELISVPGASAVVRGAIVAYDTELKHTLLGVDPSILNVHGPVHPDVAAQMASRVRDVLAVGGVPADIGLATTGVAGPEPQGGHAPGTVFIAVAVDGDVRVTALDLEGDRQTIRRRTVDAVVDTLFTRLT